MQLAQVSNLGTKEHSNSLGGNFGNAQVRMGDAIGRKKKKKEKIYSRRLQLSPEAWYPIGI